MNTFPRHGICIVLNLSCGVDSIFVIPGATGIKDYGRGFLGVHRGLVNFSSLIKRQYLMCNLAITNLK